MSDYDFKERSDLAMIVVTDVVENEDGSATYTFDLDDVSSKKITELGLEFILTCAAYGLDIQQALEDIRWAGEQRELAKKIDGPYTAEEVGEMFDG
jgi:hypothetical protein